jgi:hypothetical protein
MMVMACNEDRQGDEDECSNQAAPPPAILPQHVALETIETFLKAFFRFFPLTSSAARFLRHEVLPPLLICVDPTAVFGLSAHSPPLQRRRQLVSITSPHQVPRSFIQVRDVGIDVDMISGGVRCEQWCATLRRGLRRGGVLGQPRIFFNRAILQVQKMLQLDRRAPRSRGGCIDGQALTNPARRNLKLQKSQNIGPAPGVAEVIERLGYRCTARIDRPCLLPGPDLREEM